MKQVENATFEDWLMKMLGQKTEDLLPGSMAY
jgi:hypothetical protein